MFTGIITDIGRIREITRSSGLDSRLVIQTVYETKGIDIGASISCSGVCLTVTELGTDFFVVEASDESLARTTIGQWREGTGINLERALTAGQEMGGHIVTGHVDAVIPVLTVEPIEGSIRFEFLVPPVYAGYVAEKGSVTLDGVSLTVNDVEDRDDGASFSVNIISHTQDATTLGKLAVDSKVNFEVDVLARYVARMTSV